MVTICVLVDGSVVLYFSCVLVLVLVDFWAETDGRGCADGFVGSDGMCALIHYSTLILDVYEQSFCCL